MKRKNKTPLVDFIEAFIALTLGGTFLEILFQFISETPNPFISVPLINVFNFLLPSFLNILGVIWGIILAIIITLYNYNK